jgi:hypothetical protein
LIELNGVTADILGVGDHAADVFSHRLAQVAFPVILEGFGAGDENFILTYFNRENAVSLGKGIGHHPGNRGCIYLQGVDVVVGLFRPLREPLGQSVQIQGAAGFLALQPGLGDQFQWMALASGPAAPCLDTNIGRENPFGILLGNLTTGDQRRADIPQGQGTSMWRGWMSAVGHDAFPVRFR